MERLTENLYTTMTNSLIEKKELGEVSEKEYRTQLIELRDERAREEWLEIERDIELKRIENIVKSSNLGRRFRDRTFDNFVTVKANENIYNKCYEYAKNFKDQKDGKGLMLIGTVGTGKTHLVAAISNYIMHKHKIPVKFGDVNSLLSEIKNTYGEKATQTESQVIKNLSKVELLVIDDLGKEKSTEWSNSIIYTIINNRYEDYKPVIITTNLQVKELEDIIGEASISRLIETCDFIKIDGADVRKTKLRKLDKD